MLFAKKNKTELEVPKKHMENIMELIIDMENGGKRDDKSNS